MRTPQAVGSVERAGAQGHAGGQRQDRLGRHRDQLGIGAGPVRAQEHACGTELIQPACLQFRVAAAGERVDRDLLPAPQRRIHKGGLLTQPDDFS